MSVLRTAGACLMLTLVGSCLVAGASAQAFPPPPTAADAAEAATLIAAMKANERGPYLRIRWFCADGTVHAPQGTPCAERGGGVQHAEPGPGAARLAGLGFHVGTILQATSFDTFADASRGGYRLRELVLERYLVDADDGWVLRRARYYRGALQVEDEEAAGRLLLERLFGDAHWFTTNYFLASRLALATPHERLGAGTGLDRIRALASEVAALDEGFMRLRVKIHSVPSADDADAVDAYLRRGSHEPGTRARLEELRDALRAQYDAQRALASLEAYRRRLGPPLADELGRLRATLSLDDPAAALSELARLAPMVRGEAETASTGALRLDLLDLVASLHERAFVLAQAMGPEPSRRAGVTRLTQYVELAYAAGYLSGREREALRSEAARLVAADAVTAMEYKSSVGYLSRSLEWARGTVRGTFQPVLDRYAAVEPAAAGLSDALLRGSVLLPLATGLDHLQSDADAAMGANHVILGTAVAQGVRGLNPGVAFGPLRILETGHEHDVDAGTIYVLPETPPELNPVAGVLTLAEGNLLSHVQLLARNLGIPNASVAPDLRERLAAAEDRTVFYAVTPLGRVVLQLPEDLDSDQRALVPTDETPARVVRHRLDASRLRLDRWRPIPLAQLRSSDSGVIVGPKAANLGQLAADFPGRVSSAAALPFGMFLRHVDRPFGGGEGTVVDELRAAYARAAALRAAGASDGEVDAFMLERLAWVREAIEGLEWIPEVRAEVVAALEATLGGDVSRGVFVRSDTNVEDLPEFSGAGLNLTVPHQTTVDGVLASIKRVWTSPFSERAYLWRSRILEEQGDVYPSVLLQESVPSDHSGVLITSGLQEGGPDDLTVVAAEGVGGAVEGEDAETLLVGAEGQVRLLSQAKAARRREIQPGGTRWVAAQRPDTLLQPGELRQLLEVVDAWKAKKAGTPDEDTTWDMEYGFVGGRLWLFQVRPFVRFRNSDVYGKLEALDRGALSNAGRRVPLSAPMEGLR